MSKLRLKDKYFCRLDYVSDGERFRDFFEKYYSSVIGYSHNMAFDTSLDNFWYGVVDGVLRCYSNSSVKLVKGAVLVGFLDQLLEEIEISETTPHGYAELQVKGDHGIQELPTMRNFETGATRNIDEGKLDFEGFLSAPALEAFSTYMNSHRLQADGKLRDSDNWQKGMPIDVYMKSMWRHFFDVWKNHRGLKTPEDQITNLCALMFNVQGMLHELIKKQE